MEPADGSLNYQVDPNSQSQSVFVDPAAVGSIPDQMLAMKSQQRLNPFASLNHVSDSKIPQERLVDLHPGLGQGLQSVKMLGSMSLTGRMLIQQSKSVTPAEMLKKIVNNLETQNVHKLSKLMDNKKYYHKFNSKHSNNNKKQ